jgi:hypothetical protein
MFEQVYFPFSLLEEKAEVSVFEADTNNDQQSGWSWWLIAIIVLLIGGWTWIYLKN